MADLSSLIGGPLATAVLQRTYMMEVRPNGVPQILLVFDAITEETPEFTAEITQYPVEDGPEITDHIQLKNPSLSLKGTVSSTPIDLKVAIANVLSGALSTVTSSQFRSNILSSGSQAVAGVAGAALQSGAGKSELLGNLAGAAMDSLARSALISAYERKARFSVITKRQRFDNMVIESLAFPRDSETGAQVIFELELKKIIVVSPNKATLTQVAESVSSSATEISNQSEQTAKVVPTSLSNAAEAVRS